MSAAFLLTSSSDDWYVFQAMTCHGPYTRAQVARLVAMRKVERAALLRRGDWSTWRHLPDCIHELAEDESSAKAREPYKSERRIAAPRVPLMGDIVVTGPGGEVIGSGHDISVSGLFVATIDAKFSIGTPVSVTASSPQLPAPLEAVAEIRRFNLDPRHPIGYGISFTRLDNRALVEITRLVGVRSITEFGEVANRDIS